MKIYLINPDYMKYGNPPLAFSYLTSYINKIHPDVEIKILDQIHPKKVMKIIMKDKPDIIGLTSVSENWYKIKELAKEIKNITDAKLIIGGVHVTTCPKCFNNSVFDYAILGEGEIPFTKLITQIKINKTGIKHLSKIKGLLFRDGKNIINTGLPEHIKDLSELPPIDFSLLNMKYYTMPKLSQGLKRTFMILTSRGCCYNCSFCSSSCFWESKIRFFPAERVVKEIEQLYNYGFRIISLGDDLFSINKTRIREIIKLLKEKKLLGKIKYDCSARANIFDGELALLLKELGVTTVSFGFESGSEKMLRWLKGGNVTIADNKRAVAICKKHGLRINAFFMIGSPYETLEDMEETYEFIKEQKLDSFMIYQTLAYPGTGVWKYAIENNKVKEDFYESKNEEWMDKTPYLLADVNPERFEEIFKKIKDMQITETRGDYIKKLKDVKLSDIASLFNIMLIKKAFGLRHKFINKVKQSKDI